MKKEYAALRKKLETYFQVMRIDSEVRYLYVKLVVDVGWQCGKTKFPFFLVQLARQAGPLERACRPK